MKRMMGLLALLLVAAVSVFAELPLPECFPCLMRTYLIHVEFQERVEDTIAMHVDAESLEEARAIAIDQVWGAVESRGRSGAVIERHATVVVPVGR